MAREPQSSDIRSVSTYHPFTIGWLCSGIIRKVTGMSCSRFFAQEIARPLDLDFWIGLPEQEEPRVAYLVASDTFHDSPVLGPVPALETKKDVLFWSQWWNPPQLSLGSFENWNTHQLRAGEIASVSGVGSARSIAKLYAELVSEAGTLISAETAKLAQRELCNGWDPVLGTRRQHSIVFELNAEGGLGSDPAAFGHGGAGGPCTVLGRPSTWDFRIAPISSVQTSSVAHGPSAFLMR
jgi:CubicO group peptidase (beta-lactamase class C family)